MTQVPHAVPHRKGHRVKLLHVFGWCALLLGFACIGSHTWHAHRHSSSAHAMLTTQNRQALPSDSSSQAERGARGSGAVQQQQEQQPQQQQSQRQQQQQQQQQKQQQPLPAFEAAGSSNSSRAAAARQQSRTGPAAATSSPRTSPAAAAAAKAAVTKTPPAAKAAATKTPAAAAAAAKGAQPAGLTKPSPKPPPVPHILHHMHKSLEALNPVQRKLYDRCMELHPHWERRFWDDAKLEAFVKEKFPWYYPTWSSMHPLIKKLDSSRYMILHHYGGVYMDVDVECVRPLDSLIEPLSPGAAWMGDFPEPMFVMSDKGAKLWLTVLDRIKRVWKDLDAWHATGPAGLDAGVLEHVRKYGTGVFVPYLHRRTEPDFEAYIKGKNNSLPYFQLSNGNLRLPPEHKGLRIWHAPSFEAGAANFGGPDKLPALPHSNITITPDLTVGFIANELLDPVGCSASALAHCVEDFCAKSWPLNYLVHHCMNTWRGRIGTT